MNKIKVLNVKIEESIKVDRCSLVNKEQELKFEESVKPKYRFLNNLYS